ncbi:hypothetical protein CC1G_10671 [Coprinopsis cinerea okayama7|uniref:Uncharacterized protein n=1 Tax=Coprinopsis cinerea (strain Okayama-7 / 130 / ATCC MYA-4618 / FGSC 9003) TaxID=240176 RepID=A8NDP5_COPC7|nr:hypothetical protein CC1G_10671 [Coprinopsis cinerea okayama7\|eukprot:XP_001832822.2 hypothetical protein CC1G_10671 [Coprinopsis cinerea okayama7\
MLDTTDIDHIDIDFTDREETNSAFQLEGFFELWEEWAQALRDEDNDQKEGCGNPDCGDTPPCDPLLDDMACGLCALQGPEAYDQCGFFKQYMAYHLQHDAGMPITSIPGFLEQFQTFKTTLLGDRPPSASRAGVNGDMWICLWKARDLMPNIRRFAYTLPAVRAANEMESTLEAARKINAVITAEAVRSRRRWIRLSRILNRALNKLEDPALSASRKVARTRDILNESRTAGLLFVP